MQFGALLRHPLIVLAVVAAGMLGVAWFERRHAEADQSALIKYFETQRAVNDSTQARAAATHLAREQELEGLVTAAKSLNGKLVAGFALLVQRRDTVLVHDSLPTVNAPDGTRTATMHDSTFAGVIDTKITAPPFPAPLSATTAVTRPAFRPEVGFVQVGTGYIATVVWNGEHFQIEAPFLEKSKPKTRWMIPYVGATAFTNGSFSAQAGVLASIGRLRAGPVFALPLQIGGRPAVGLSTAWTF